MLSYCITSLLAVEAGYSAEPASAPNHSTWQDLTGPDPGLWNTGGEAAFGELLPPGLFGGDAAFEDSPLDETVGEWGWPGQGCCRALSLSCEKCRQPWKSERQICRQFGYNLHGCEQFSADVCCSQFSLSCEKCKQPGKSDRQICRQFGFDLDGCEQFGADVCCSQFSLTCEKCKQPWKSDRQICSHFDYELDGCEALSPPTCCLALNLTCEKCKNPGKSEYTICRESGWMLEGCGSIGR